MGVGYDFGHKDRLPFCATHQTILWVNHLESLAIPKLPTWLVHPINSIAGTKKQLSLGFISHVGLSLKNKGYPNISFF